MLIAEALKFASERLRAASVPNDVLDAQTLLAEALGVDRTYLIVNFSRRLNDDELSRYQTLIERRATGEPLQYIVGHQEFFGLEFEVNSAVLIPRPETEIIIEETIRLVGENGIERPLLVDVGTGSGCIAITLARELEGARVIAVDLSSSALRLAKRNAERYGLLPGIDFLESDLLDAVSESIRADFIISNPPYVSEIEWPNLQREVRDWEPRTALTDFGDGLSFFRRLLSDSPARLRLGGYLICEMGYQQAEAVTAMIDLRVWSEPSLIDDLQGIPRTLVLQKR